MSVYAWGRTLCETAYGAGQLTVAARERVEWLVQDGLHPEQVLIGTGLLTIEQYAAAVQRAFSIELARLDCDLHSVTAWPFAVPEERVASLLLLEREDGVRVLVAADVWDWPETEWHKVVVQAEKRSIVIQYGYLSEMKTFMRAVSEQSPFVSIVDWLSAFQEIADHEHAHAATLTTTTQGCEVRLDERGKAESELNIPAAYLPALSAAVERGVISQEWSGQTVGLAAGDALRLTHRHGPSHPVQRLQGLEHFWQEKTGSLLCVDPDPFVKSFVQMRAPLRSASAVAAEPQMALFSIQLTNEEDQQEEVLHRLLAGQRLCVFLSVEQLTPFYEIAQTQIPLRVLRARRLNQEITWESYLL